MIPINIQPKAHNADKGYYFDVTKAEYDAHKSRSLEEVFAWLESANSFVYAIQSPQEKQKTKFVRSA